MVEGMLRNIEAGETALYAHKATVDRADGGHGLGAELRDWAGTRAADEGADWLRVDVWTTNERLQALLPQAGLHLGPNRGPPAQSLVGAVPVGQPSACPRRTCTRSRA